MWNWLIHFFGIDNGSGQPYLFWSGIGADLSEFLIFGAIVGVFRKHNCHVKGCPRIGKHPVDGTPYIVCAKHHPDIPAGDVTADQVVAASKSAKA